MDQRPLNGPDAYGTSNSSSLNGPSADGQQNITIPVIEERVHLDKKTVESGSVRITKIINEQEVPVNIPLIQEEHDIQRVPVNEYVDVPPPPIRYEGDTMIIPIVQEVMVVQKRLMVVEELHITKQRVETHDVQHVRLKREEIRVERLSNDQAQQQPNPTSPNS